MFKITALNKLDTFSMFTTTFMLKSLVSTTQLDLMKPCSHYSGALFLIELTLLYNFLTFPLLYIIKFIYNNQYSCSILLLGGVIMSFAAWSAIFMTLIGAMSGAIFGTISSKNKSKSRN